MIRGLVGYLVRAALGFASVAVFWLVVQRATPARGGPAVAAIGAPRVEAARPTAAAVDAPMPRAALAEPDAPSVLSRRPGGPHVRFVNTLIAPVRVRASGHDFSVPARTALVLPVDAPIEWEVVRPHTASRELGEIAGGVFGEAAADAGRVVATAQRRDGVPLFAPLLSNQSREAVGIVVNRGLGSDAERICCEVPAGAHDQFVGYYRLLPESNVHLLIGGRVRRGFLNLGASVDHPASSIVLTIPAR